MRSDDLNKKWPVCECDTIQKYLVAAYGRLDNREGSYAFRGVTKHYPNIRPPIDRRKIAPDNPVKVETRLLKEFRRRGWKYLTRQEQRRCLFAETRWSNRRNTGAMVVARHRMLPTRCIDWTYEPLYSLLFACDGDYGHSGEVWWFNRAEFDYCVGAQWPALFGKLGHVEDDIEEEFIKGKAAQWVTALDYTSLAGDRLDLQKGWITVAGQLGTCHAEEIHRLGVRGKGRLVVPARLKPKALAFLERMGVTRQALGFGPNDHADEIAQKIREEFEGKYPCKSPSSA